LGHQVIKSGTEYRGFSVPLLKVGLNSLFRSPCTVNVVSIKWLVLYISSVGCNNPVSALQQIPRKTRKTDFTHS